MNIQLPVLSVSQLNRHVRHLLEHEMGEVCVEGEVSNLSKPASGHFYFTLKDASAQLRCVYFRNRHVNRSNSLQNGQQVLAYGRLSLYETRGDYQLIVEELKEAGQGDLYRQYEQLKTKLAEKGLFDPARKKALPTFPDLIGVITSSNGAALRDILTTIKRRYPISTVVVYPCEVQGRQAAPQLISAINQANEHQRCEVLLLARGGGSLEDLWAFNDEHLAYAIASSSIPIVSGIGHETDFTIADFVADLRAATPTSAAEAVTPNLPDLLAFLKTMQTRLMAIIMRFIQHQRLLLNHEIQKITSPGRLIMSHWQTLDDLKNQLYKSFSQSLSQKKHRLHLVTTRLKAQNPTLSLQQTRSHLQHLQTHLIQYTMVIINHFKQQLTTILATLHAVSPLATLDRGYAIVTHNQKVIFDSQAIDLGDVIDIRLARGKLSGKIIRKGE